MLHKPGEAQADFGTADFYEGETLYRDAKYLVLRFPHSNGAYLQLNYGENLECLLEGLVAMFEHIVYNTTTLSLKSAKRLPRIQ